MMTRRYERYFKAKCPMCHSVVMQYDVDGDHPVDIRPCRHLAFIYEDFLGECVFKREMMKPILTEFNEDLSENPNFFFKRMGKEFNLEIQKHIGPYNPSGVATTFLGFKMF